MNERGEDRGSCLDPDRILDVCAPLGERPADALLHLLHCPECRAVLETVGAVRSTFEPIRAGIRAEALAERVIERTAPQEPAGRTRAPDARVRSPGASRWPVAVASWLLAASVGFSGTLLVTAGPLDVSLSGAVMVAIVTGGLPFVPASLVERLPV